MIRSMTGFGRYEHSENGTRVAVEIQSVNGRFLEVRFRLPKVLYEYENEFKKLAQEHIQRGKVFINVTLDQAGITARTISVDFDVAERYFTMSREISERLGILNSLDIGTMMELPDVIQRKEPENESETSYKITLIAVGQALAAHNKMRESEGVAIGEDVRARLESINTYLQELEKKLPMIVENNTIRLRNKIENLVGKENFDESRFAMELAIYADRIDITEECVRLKSHNEQFSVELTTEKTSGRKLSFLLQEMNREANTIGAKINDAESAQIVVKIKEELEKMREQVENME